MDIVTFDLDSTIADTSPRHHLLVHPDHDRNDWTAYAKACADDVPVKAVVTLMNVFRAAGYGVHIVSARMEASRPETLAWLDKHEIRVDGVALYDEPEPEIWDHGATKAKMIQRLLDQGYKVVMHVDDHIKVRHYVEEQLGIPVLTVSPPWLKELPKDALR